MSVRILTGDVLDMLATQPPDSVDCVVTSPPYWGQRDYGIAGQLGMEPTIGEHLAAMVEVFRAVRRVMRPEGTLWLNYGDCYATTPNGRGAADVKAAGKDDRTFRDKPFSTIQGVLKRKDLCLLNDRLRIALQEDGWWVRSKIVWGKPNAMPDSSGRYRPSVAFEEITLLTRSANSYYDAEAVRMPPRGNEDSNGFPGSAGGGDRVRKRATVGNTRRLLRNHEADVSPLVPPEIWNIPTAAYSGPHFATFPPALVYPCILAGCPQGGVVLDPFGGTGTVGLVADRLGRDAVLIEINPGTVVLALQRLRAAMVQTAADACQPTDAGPLFAEVAP